MKIYIHTDIEGVAGMVHFEDRDSRTVDNHFHRQRMFRLLTGEVNAAIEAAVACGATEVLVNDSHGSGYSILFEELHPMAQIIHGPLTRQPFWTPCLDETCDAVLCLAQHAMAGTNGVLAHSRWQINGLDFGEAGMCMALAGHYGVPTVMVSGDNVATQQCRDLVPEIETAVVKEALSPYNAKSWTPAKAQELIREAVTRGLERRDEIPPFVIEPPFHFGPPPGEPVEGDNFVEIVKQRLCNLYDYELQDLDPWPMEPGHREPALPKPLRKQWRESRGTRKPRR